MNKRTNFSINKKKTINEKKTIGPMQIVGLIVFLIAGLVGAGMAVAWEGPPGPPPDPNVNAPLHVGSTAQQKTGNLTLGAGDAGTEKLRVYGYLGVTNGGIYNPGTTYQGGWLSLEDPTQIVGDLKVTGGALFVESVSTTGDLMVVPTAALIGGQNLIYGNMVSGSEGNLLMLQVNYGSKFVVDETGSITEVDEICLDGPAGSECRSEWWDGGPGGSSYWTDDGLYIYANTVGVGATARVYDTGGFYLDDVGTTANENVIYGNLVAGGNGNLLLLKTGGSTERMKVANTGNTYIDSNTLVVDAVNDRVGVGTTAPAVDFQVNTSTGTADVAVQRNSGKFGKLAAGTVAAGFFYDNTGYYFFQPTANITDSNLTETTVITYDANGQMALGDYSADATLEIVKHDLADYLAVSSAKDNNGDILIVKNSGRVGVGDTDPGSKLEVAGDLMVSAGNLAVDTNNAIYGNMTGGLGSLLLLENEASTADDGTHNMFRVENDGDVVVAGCLSLNGDRQCYWPSPGGPSVSSYWTDSGSYIYANTVTAGDNVRVYDDGTLSINTSVGDGQNVIYGNGLVSGTGNLLLLKNSGNDVFKVTGDGFVAQGNAADPNIQMFWDSGKGALRGGYRTGTTWDDANVGNYSFAYGNNVKASGEYAIAMGNSDTAGGTYAVALGNNSQVNGSYSVGMGNNNTASGIVSIALGTTNTASGNWSIALGVSNTATAQPSISIGRLNDATAQRAIAIGESNDADGSYAIAIGNNNNAGDASADTAAIALGYYADALNPYAVALGRYVTAQAYGAITIGSGVDATNRLVNSTDNSLAIGFNSTQATIEATDGHLSVNGDLSVDAGAQAADSNNVIYGSMTGTTGDLLLLQVNSGTPVDILRAKNNGDLVVDGCITFGTSGERRCTWPSSGGGGSLWTDTGVYIYPNNTIETVKVYASGNPYGISAIGEHAGIHGQGQTVGILGGCSEFNDNYINCENLIYNGVFGYGVNVGTFGTTEVADYNSIKFGGVGAVPPTPAAKAGIYGKSSDVSGIGVVGESSFIGSYGRGDVSDELSWIDPPDTELVGIGVYSYNGKSDGYNMVSWNSAVNGKGIWALSHTLGIKGQAASDDGVAGTGVWGVVADSDGSTCPDYSYGVRAESLGSNSCSYGLYASADAGYGVYSISNSNMGVYGETHAEGGSGEDYGVYGTVKNLTGGGAGVAGVNDNGYGVYAYSKANTGELAAIGADNANGGYAIYAESYGGGIGIHSEGQIGVDAYGNGADGYGVKGEVTTAGRAGVYGTFMVAAYDSPPLTPTWGVYGKTAARGYSYGVYGESTNEDLSTQGWDAVGVAGKSMVGYGVYGESTGSEGVYGTSTNHDGVHGEIDNNYSAVAGLNWGTGSGVYGDSAYDGNGTGVLGIKSQGGDLAGNAGLFIGNVAIVQSDAVSGLSTSQSANLSVAGDLIVGGDSFRLVNGACPLNFTQIDEVYIGITCTDVQMNVCQSWSAPITLRLCKRN